MFFKEGNKINIHKITSNILPSVNFLVIKTYPSPSPHRRGGQQQLG